MAEPFVGEIRAVGFTFAPRGWANCDGQLMAISSNEALFSLYGTTYGGDGRTTFGLPDLRGRVPIHPGSGPGLPTYRWGQKGGAPTVNLTAAQTASHAHDFAVSCNTGDGSTDEPQNAFVAKAGDGATNFASAATANAKMGAGTSSPVGGQQSHDNMQPYQVIRYCCALTGIYPSRS